MPWFLDAFLPRETRSVEDFVRNENEICYLYLSCVGAHMYVMVIDDETEYAAVQISPRFTAAVQSSSLLALFSVHMYIHTRIEYNSLFWKNIIFLF